MSMEDERLLVVEDVENPSKKRWVALGLFCALNCTQCYVWNTWGPIAETAMEAFPSWRKSSVALLSDWGSITYLTCCLPTCWILNSSRFVTPIRLAAVLSTLATFSRCISSQEMIFTITAHLAAVLDGLAGVIIGPSTALMSAVYFPTGERTTATGISSAFNQFGMALSYLLGPAVVKNGDFYFNSTSRGDNLRVQIMSLMRIEFVAQLLVLLGILSFFPGGKKNSGGNAETPRLGVFESLNRLIKQQSMWFLCLAAALSQGGTGPWLAMITIAFGNIISQSEADNLAFWTVISSSILSLLISWVMDVFQGHLKLAIYTLLLTSSAMFLWVILLDYKILVFHKNELYAAVVLGISLSWSSPALFLELASEIAYPVSEAIVGGYMIFLSNIVGSLFYLSYFVPGVGDRWSSCIVLGNLTLSTILVGYVKDEYNRSKSE
ncbi:disrupted in renal carcinoma protein 2 homolog [Fopius arisanus]|uniref:Disrupted in renal carcinoma protein 2 homolog n=1 Tax=Fopius arisanus TaxID=64838 RepID=A0A9R1T7J2_9HYME|nr:PREDICTED: disrupted in renal carcinoma protein 2 homolog [Fopius arisanus]